MKYAFDPERDLLLEREVDISRSLLWRGWTEPELLKQWFTPTPWRTTECVIDLRPGGAFHTVMEGPDGAGECVDGCYLEVVPQERLIFTDALGPGYRPSARPFMTAIVTFDDLGNGRTRYTAHVRHKSAADRETHEKMGFHDGWGKAFDQLVALANTL
ncbi:MAG: SRPBCC family protein [Nitrospinae bacterium]|nr:SRPBCC family protein [Nitrospinota bacterium]